MDMQKQSELANKYRQMIHDMQVVINRSMLLPVEFNQLEDIEIENLMTAVEAMNARKDTLVRLVMQAQKRNGTYDYSDMFGLDTLDK